MSVIENAYPVCYYEYEGHSQSDRPCFSNTEFLINIFGIMKYSSFKLFEYIIVLILVVAYVIEYCISNHFSKPGWLYIVIGTFVILSALLFVTEHIANKKYPQWENLWRMPSSIIALLAAVFAATIIIAAFFNISSGWYLFLLVLLRVSPDYYYAKKI